MSHFSSFEHRLIQAIRKLDQEECTFVADLVFSAAMEKPLRGQLQLVKTTKPLGASTPNASTQHAPCQEFES